MQADPEIKKLLDALTAEHEHLRGRTADMGKMLKEHRSQANGSTSPIDPPESKDKAPEGKDTAEADKSGS
jgi:hypothetical protein